MDQDPPLSKAMGAIENVEKLSMREGHRGRSVIEIMSMILWISLTADLCLLLKYHISMWNIRIPRDGWWTLSSAITARILLRIRKNCRVWIGMAK